MKKSHNIHIVVVSFPYLVTVLLPHSLYIHSSLTLLSSNSSYGENFLTLLYIYNIIEKLV